MATNKFLVFVTMFVMIMFLASTVSAFKFDNVKDDKVWKGGNFKVGKETLKENNLWGKYKPIEIKNAFGLGKTLFKGALVNHTEECGVDCESVIQIEHSGGVFIEDIRFIGGTVISYEILANGERINVGQVLEEGDYEIEIIGKKVPVDSVDWQIKTQGEWLTEWANWTLGDVVYSSSQTVCGDVYARNLVINNSATLTICDNGAGDEGYVQFYVAGDFVMASGTTINGDSKGASGRGAYSTATSHGSAGNGDGAGGGGRYYLGGSPAWSGAGGGGGHYGVGGTGGNGGTGSASGGSSSSYDSVVSKLLYIGSGGGTGSQVSGAGVGAGGDGGGGVLVYASNITINGIMYLRGGGAGSPTTTSSYASAGSGGGSGGAVVLYGKDININSARFDVYGGSGSTGKGEGASYYLGAGGGGGGAGGMVKMFYENSISNSSITTNINGGGGGGVYYTGQNGGGGSTGIVSYTSDTYTGISGGIIELDSPEDDYISPLALNTFNCSAYLFGITNLTNMSLWTNESGTFEMVNSTSYSGTMTESASWDRTMSDGSYVWNCQACDTDGTCAFADANYTFEVDSVNPIINIIYPTSKLDFGKDGELITLNWTVVDTNLDSCWYVFNGSTYPVTCNTISNITVNDLNDNTVTFWANDTLGNSASELVTWTYYLWQESASFNSEVGEISDQEFTTNLTLPDGDTITSAKFIYNETEYSPDIDLYSGGALLSYELETPNIETTTNFSFYWQITINPVINTTPETQTVIAVNMDNCSTFTDLVINYTLVDEETEALITGANSSIEIDVVLYTVGGTTILTYNNIYTDTPYAPVCMEELLANTSYEMDITTSYIADGYVQEFWYIDDGILEANNTQLNDYTTQDVTLRALSIDDSTTFLFRYFDEFYSIHKDSVITVLRNYIGQGEFKEVERCQTDSNGECHLHLVEEDVIYKFRVTDQGVFEYLSGEYNAKCLETVCQIKLRKTVEGEEWDGELDNLAEGTYSVSSDKDTRTVSVAFNLEETGVMDLEVYEYDENATSDVLVASDTVTAKSGTAEATIPLVYGNKTYYTVIRHNDAFVSSQWVDMNESGYQYFGNLGLFLAGLLIITLGLIAVSSGGWSIGFLCIGLLVASITKLVDMDFYLMMYIVCAGALIIWKLSTRRSI